VFGAVTGRHMRINQNTRDYFAVGDNEQLTYEEKLERYSALADAYFQTAEFEAFCSEALPELREVMVEYVESSECDDVVVSSMRAEVEPERQDEMIDRSRASLGAWAADARR
jgi:hypothetical protein